MRTATTADIPLLVGLMAEFYAEANYQLDPERAASAFARLFADPHLGNVWVIDEQGEDVGYIVITFKHAMEYAGMVACVDDLYVKPDCRNRGLSTRALLEIRSSCETSGILAMTVEVGPNNGPAQKVYRRSGFAETPDRQLLTLALARPAHIISWL